MKWGNGHDSLKIQTMRFEENEDQMFRSGKKKEDSNNL